MLIIVLTACYIAGCAQADLVSFPAEDGAEIYADVYGVGADVVILAHGGRFDRTSWAPQAKVLAGRGFRVIAIDFRGRGLSHAPEGAAVRDEDVHLDVLAAIDYARREGAERISVVGASFGGWAAAKAAARSQIAIERLVLLAAPVDEPEALPGGTLFILAEEDYSGEGTLRLPEIRRQYESAPSPKELVLLEGSAHAQHLFATDQGSRLMSEIIRFLSQR